MNHLSVGHMERHLSEPPSQSQVCFSGKSKSHTALGKELKFQMRSSKRRICKNKAKFCNMLFSAAPGTLWNSHPLFLRVTAPKCSWREPCALCHSSLMLIPRSRAGMGSSSCFRAWGGLQQPNTKISDSEKPDELHPLKTPKHRGNSVSDCFEVI